MLHSANRLILVSQLKLRGLLTTVGAHLALNRLRFVNRHVSRGVGPHNRGERGQATAEYALVLLGAATIALLLLAWATGSGKIGQLFDTVFDHLMGEVR